MAQVLITFTDTAVSAPAAPAYVLNWDSGAGTFTQTLTASAAQVFDDVTDASAITACENAIIALKGAETHPTTVLPPHH